MQIHFLTLFLHSHTLHYFFSINILLIYSFLFYFVEYFYRQHCDRSRQSWLRWCLRLYVWWTRLWSDRVFVATEYIVASYAQLLHAGSSGGRLQYRWLKLSMGRGRNFWNESVTNIDRRLQDSLFSSSQQLSRVCGLHENFERPAIVTKQLPRVSGTFTDLIIDNNIKYKKLINNIDYNFYSFWQYQIFI